MDLGREPSLFQPPLTSHQLAHSNRSSFCTNARYLLLCDHAGISARCWVPPLLEPRCQLALRLMLRNQLFDPLEENGIPSPSLCCQITHLKSNAGRNEFRKPSRQSHCASTTLMATQHSQMIDDIGPDPLAPVGSMGLY